MQQMLIARTSTERAHYAVNSLYDTNPDLSARVTATPAQATFLGFTLGAFPALLYLYPYQTVFFIHVLMTLFFMLCVSLRLYAALYANIAHIIPPLKSYRKSDLPEYAVVIALYRESAVIAQLVAVLKRLNWPKSKLKIYFVCEADDEETASAFEKVRLAPNMQIIKVPNLGPRTKPKALMYALPLINAQFVALYDAEDRPHPDQLLEAWQAMEAAGPNCACAQAPLIVASFGGGIMKSLFAFEYAALFRGLIPFLASKKAGFPLGGTSNHFRRSVLEKVGGWDPYNVTEDADLGLRLTRFGYQLIALHRPTFEDAPENVGIWIGQRSRWFKGWMQTWLVMMRSPRAMWAEMTPRAFFVANIMMLGMVASSLFHPILIMSFIGFAISFIFFGAGLPDPYLPLFVLDTANIILGYGAFALLGYVTLRDHEKKQIGYKLLAIPLYWIVMSIAAWRAAIELVWRPHFWQKTPHKPSYQAQGKP